MGQQSSIQWTDATWNIARGCTKVDEDCKFCYMYRESLNDTRYNPKVVTKTKTVFNLPLKLKEPSKIFTSSLTVFVKQLGTHLAKKMNLKHRHGGDINEWPEHLRIREFPREVSRG